MIALQFYTPIIDTLFSHLDWRTLQVMRGTGHHGNNEACSILYRHVNVSTTPDMELLIVRDPYHHNILFVTELPGVSLPPARNAQYSQLAGNSIRQVIDRQLATVSSHTTRVVLIHHPRVQCTRVLGTLHS